MRTELQNVKVLIWDFDGTLYRPNPDLFQAVRKAEFQVIAKYTGWNKQQVKDKFYKYYKKITPSATETVAYLCNISTVQAAQEIEIFLDRRPFLSKDEKLLELFSKLTKFRHLMIANGVRSGIEETLTVLGLKGRLFEIIVTSEIVGVNKPNEKGFRYILDYTGLPSRAHLMIGDREEVDIVPAKRLGLKTCLVWSSQSSSVADVTLPTVYDVAKILKVDPIKEE